MAAQQEALTATPIGPPPATKAATAAPATKAVSDPVVKDDQTKDAEPEAYKGQMERSFSLDIREGGKVLRNEVEQTLNVILDITLDGIIRWASPSWEEVVGTPADTIIGKPVRDLLVEDKEVFAEAMDVLQHDDSGSKFIRFAVEMGPKSALRTPVEEQPNIPHSDGDVSPSEPPPNRILPLEAQGIMVFDRSSGEETHTMWMMRPYVHREITIDLPDVLIEALGEGAEMLAHHLTSLAEAGSRDPENHPPPMPVLCRICERQITPWWFPKHTELCLQEHRAEADLQQAQEALTEHRHAIVKVLDAFDLQARHKIRDATDELPAEPPKPQYKSMPIGPASSAIVSGERSGRDSPASSSSSRTGSRDRSSARGSHHRSRSFVVRRPLVRIVELVLDLCDTALEINAPGLKESRGVDDNEIRTQSPQSESRVTQVLQWHSPSTGALDNEPGLSALCDDTTTFARTKVDSVVFFRRIIEYSERIRVEVTNLVQDCIDAALVKAARIAAGEMSDSGEESGAPDETPTEEIVFQDSLETFAPAATYMGTESLVPEPHPQPVESLAKQPERQHSPLSFPPHRIESPALSNRSESPKSCPTPKSIPNALSLVGYGSSHHGCDSDHGNESDSSMQSSLRSRTRQSLASQTSDAGLSRMGSSRERKRTSLILPPAASRQQSPGRGSGPPGSPVRSSKPRFPSGNSEALKSPLMSPTLSSHEFVSSAMSSHHNLPHHRRQSSEASSELLRAMSPRLSISHNQPPRAMPPSIKDFEIIKPISKGAFGSVYLAKKKSTGDYYAIKALKKADMVAKNQVANVKAERAIMMWQGESDFVAKLYWTFPSKDYIFLVMEYLNGGDCASLLHALGTLPEDWTKRYIAEVVKGVEHLHGREIVHRDLKPDNLLIDQKGHLKLTDFGLSRMGLIGRQKRALSSKEKKELAPDPLKQGPFRRSTSIGSSRSASFDVGGSISPAPTPALTPVVPGDNGQPSYFNLSRETSGSRDSIHLISSEPSDGPDHDTLHAAFNRLALYDESAQWNRGSPKEDLDRLGDLESPDGLSLQPSISNSLYKVGTPPQTASHMGPPPTALFDPEDSKRRFVGTPDYLAPETINGLGQDEMSDWWSLGCILFEFLYGYPPFHAETPEQVFDNILNRNINWPQDDEVEISDEARDLIDRLICIDPRQRLGSNNEEKYVSGGEEIRSHAWFGDIDWDTLNETEASFVPAPANAEDTEYFDSRGAASQDFTAEFEDQASSPATTPATDYERPHDALSRVRSQVNSNKKGLMPLHIPPHVRDGRSRRLSEPTVADDFGQFSFKNLPVLEKANKDVIAKLRSEAMQAQSRSSQGINQANSAVSTPSLESSPVLGTGIKRAMSTNKGNRSASPSSNLSQANSSPSRASQPSSPIVQFSTGLHHERRKTSSGGHAGMPPPPIPLKPANSLDTPSLPTDPRATSTGTSPVKANKMPATPNEPPSAEAAPVSRNRSLTVGSTESDKTQERKSRHSKRRSQVLSISPSSSDTEDQRQKALLRVQRRRQSSRRISTAGLSDGPLFRPLDILICEDHPVSRLVMEKLIEKLRCRAIIVQNGGEAMRYAMGSVRFDIIMMEYKLPHINGTDVARMIRETRNANAHTPIVAVTGYLKELQAPHHFDALVEKPPTLKKLIEVLARLCQWKAPPPDVISPDRSTMPPSSLRQETPASQDSPSSVASNYAAFSSSSYRGSSREDSISSASIFTDFDSKSEDLQHKFYNKHGAEEWRDKVVGGLGISDVTLQAPSATRAAPIIPSLVTCESAPADLPDQKQPQNPSSHERLDARCRTFGRDTEAAGDSGDDEDEELGNVRLRSRSPRSRHGDRSASKLGTEMMRTNSQGSVVSAGGSVTGGPSPIREVSPSAFNRNIDDIVANTELHAKNLQPPEVFPKEPSGETKNIAVDIDATPRARPAPRETTDGADNDADQQSPTPTPTRR